MKIHIHTPSFFPALVGMTYASIGHADILAEQGADVTIMAAGRPLGETIEVDDERYRALGASIQGSGLPWSRLSGDVAGLLAFTQDERPDMVLIEGWYTAAAALIPDFRKLGAKVVVASHGAADLHLDSVTPAQVLRSLTYRLSERFWMPSLMRQLDAAVILSDFRDTKRFADIAQYEKLGIPTFVAPNFSIYPFAPGLKSVSDSPTLIHIGEMRPHKNAMLAVETLALLPSRFRLTLVYPHQTDYGLEVESRIKALGLTDRVTHVIGKRRHELEAFMDLADCLLILTPSKDVQPIVAVDAMSRALPFVSTDVGCMRAFGGGLIAEGTSRGMARTIGQVFASAESYNAFSANALNYARELLSRDLSSRSMARLVERLFS